MIWWIKARRIVPVLGTGLAVVAVAISLFTDVGAPLVSWTVSRQTVPILTFAPLVLAATLALCLDSRLPEAELTSIRRVPRIDSVMILAAIFATLALSQVAYALTDSEDALIVGRNALFLTGLMLVARAITGRAGIVVATTWVVIVILVGHRTPVEYFPWAITGLPISTPHATVAAVTAIALGILLTYLTARKTQ